MLRNYFKIAIRTLRKRKGTTAINVLGLAAGLAMCFLVLLIFWNQWSHDRLHPAADRIYRVTTTMPFGHDGERYATSPHQLAPVLRNEYPGVEAATRLRKARGNVVYARRGFRSKGLYAEPSFFHVFGFPLVAGSPEDALARPYSAVVTQAFAERVFGDDNPIGKTIRREDDGPFTVTGVVNRAAHQSHLPFDVLYAFSTLHENRQVGTQDWTASAYQHYTYLRLHDGVAASKADAWLQTLLAQHMPSVQCNHCIRGFRVQALRDVLLGPILENEISEDMLRWPVFYFLGLLAGLVLLAAGFNYVNLSTARSMMRAREVGVRKTVGARRTQVVAQFVAEAVVVALGALVVAILTLPLLVRGYNQLRVVQREGLGIPGTIDPMLFGVFVGIALLVGVCAGLYPALVLSRYKPSRVLKSSARAGGHDLWLTPRKVLIVLQFAFTVVVVISATLVYQQARHIGEARYGFRTQGLVDVPLQDAAPLPFQQAALQALGVRGVALTNGIPVVWRDGCVIDSDRLAEPSSAPWYYSVDHDFFHHLELDFVAAQGLSEARFERGQAVVINEATVRLLGYASPRDALGEPLTVMKGEDETATQIVGVVRDLYTSMFDLHEPIVFHYAPEHFRHALIAVAPGAEEEALAAVERAWAQLDGVNPYEAASVEARLARYAAPLSDVSRILGLVAGLAILISCLGLLGIATYTVQTSIKEIGIRKALGASVPNLVRRLSNEFVALVVVAVAAAVPLAWWMNRMWLHDFAYRIDLGVVPFVLTVGAMLMLALMVIAPQTIRVARMNPAHTLRHE